MQYHIRRIDVLADTVFIASQMFASSICLVIRFVSVNGLESSMALYSSSHIELLVFNNLNIAK